MLEMEFSIQKRNYKLFSKKALPKPMGLRQALNKALKEAQESASKGCKRCSTPSPSSRVNRCSQGDEAAAKIEDQCIPYVMMLHKMIV